MTVTETIQSYGRDILRSENFLKSEENIQHGTVSVRRHSIQVARMSLVINRALQLNCDEEALVRIIETGEPPQA